MMANDTDTPKLLKVSGRGGLVNFEIDDAAPLEAVCHALREYLGRNRQLYARGAVAVNIGCRILNDGQQARISEIITAESGLAVKQFWCRPDILEQERQRIADLLDAQAAIVRQHTANAGAPAAKAATPAAEPEPPAPDGNSPGGDPYGAPAPVVRRTCRAGESLRFPGNVVILGNVNPGAQIIAAGDILVFGKLRGMAHAGAGGDPAAIILAMSTASPNLRIAEYSWYDDGPRAANGRRGKDGDAPTIARVHNGAIQVTPYLGNYVSDHGGNPDER